MAYTSDTTLEADMKKTLKMLFQALTKSKL